MQRYLSHNQILFWPKQDLTCLGLFVATTIAVLFPLNATYSRVLHNYSLLFGTNDIDSSQSTVL